MRSASPLHRPVTLAFVLLVGAACGTDRILARQGPASSPRPSLSTSAPAATLLRCDPPAIPQSVSAVIGTAGGTLQLGNTRLVIPGQAVPAPTTFTLTIPRSPVVEISVHAEHVEHYVFQMPVLVTIDYSRCAGRLDSLRSVTAWHIDETSKALLEDMGGDDQRRLHTITFSTGHLSGYAVADRSDSTSTP